MNTSLEIVQYNPLRADIEALKKTNAALVFDYNDKAGNQNARSHIYKMRQKKADVERVRKSVKQEALEFGRKVDAVAAELTGELDGMIVVHQKPIDEIEARVAAEKQTEADRIERERLEAERVEREKQQAALDAERAEAKRIADELAAIKHAQEVERIQREAAERARTEADQRAKSEQEAAARRDAQARAERERQEAITAAERAKVEAERNKLEAERRALREAEEAKARAEREQAEAVRRATEEIARKQREEEEAKQLRLKAQREAEARRLKQKAVRNALVADIAKSIEAVVEIESSVAIAIASALLDGKIDRVSVDTREPALA